jgi:hypothetical protein
MTRMRTDEGLPAVNREQAAYWLRRCHGFRVDSQGTRMGTVEEVLYGAELDRPAALLIRTGTFIRTLETISVDDVETNRSTGTNACRCGTQARRARLYDARIQGTRYSLAPIAPTRSLRKTPTTTSRLVRDGANASIPRSLLTRAPESPARTPESPQGKSGKTLLIAESLPIPYLGCGLTLQGHGPGTALMRAALDRCDKEVSSVGSSSMLPTMT